MKQKYDLIVIGFGKAGKTLAAKLRMLIYDIFSTLC